MKKFDGGPAYPYNELNQGDLSVYAQHAGMSLRDAIAIAALPICVTKFSSFGFTDDELSKAGITRNDLMSRHEAVAKESYKYADAMLAERVK